MSPLPDPSPAERNRRTVRRLTRGLAALTLVATAAFGAAAASATRHDSASTADSTSSDVVAVDSSSTATSSPSTSEDDGSSYGFSAPSQGVQPSFGSAPSATSGGS